VSAGARSATALITHRVREERQADYEKWIGEIAPLSKASPGNLDWHIVRPIPGLSETYTVVIRFDSKTRTPVRWKQFLVTWSAIYPLVLGVPLLVAPLLHRLGAPGSRLLTTLVATGIDVFLMVYLVMPRYTKLLHRWLFS